MKLFTFGDSFSEGYNDFAIWSTSYIKWKGYKPKLFSEIIAKKLNAELINYGIGGNDNYSILESFFKHYSEITKDDLVLINWSSIERFRLVTKSGEWITMVPNFKNVLDDLDISERTVEEIFVNRTSDKFLEEVNYWIDYINLTNNHIPIIHWTPFTTKLNCHPFGGYNTVGHETNYEIPDGHFSELGQIELAEDMMKVIKRKLEGKNLI
jgi:lysophospholipase L1-like esterase